MVSVWNMKNKRKRQQLASIFMCILPRSTKSITSQKLGSLLRWVVSVFFPTKPFCLYCTRRKCVAHLWRRCKCTWAGCVRAQWGRAAGNAPPSRTCGARTGARRRAPCPPHPSRSRWEARAAASPRWSTQIRTTSSSQFVRLQHDHEGDRVDGAFTDVLVASRSSWKNSSAICGKVSTQIIWTNPSPCRTESKASRWSTNPRLMSTSWSSFGRSRKPGMAQTHLRYRS